MSSEKLREKGNQIFRNLQNGSNITKFKTRVKHYEQAIKLFAMAREKASNDADISKATKNSAIAHFEISKEYRNKRAYAKSIESVTESLRFLRTATSTGKRCMAPDWVSNLQCFALDVTELFRQLTIDASQTIDERRAHCARLKQADVLDTVCAARLNFNEAEFLFHAAVVLREEASHRCARQILSNTYNPLEEAKRLCRLGDGDRIVLDGDTLEELEESISQEKRVCEAYELLNTAEKLWKTTVFDTEEYSTEALWHVSDLFHEAITVAEKSEIEVEAIARARLSTLYLRYLRIDLKAKSNARAVMAISETMKPRSVTHTEWYVEAVGTLKILQEAVTREEEQQWDKVREKHLPALKTEITELNNAADDSRKLLKHIYVAHPPKNQSHKLDNVALKDPEKLIKVLRSAIIHYHPDKADVEKNGMQWKVLTEEITKRLTVKYEQMRGCS